MRNNSHSSTASILLVHHCRRARHHTRDLVCTVECVLKLLHILVGNAGVFQSGRAFGKICQYCTSRLYRSKGLTKRRWAGLVLILFTKEYVGKRHARGRDVINAEATFSLRGEVDCHTLELVFALHASGLRKILERLWKTSAKASHGMAMNPTSSLRLVFLEAADQSSLRLNFPLAAEPVIAPTSPLLINCKQLVQARFEEWLTALRG